MGLIVLIAFAIYVLLSIGLAVGAQYLGKRKGWKWCRWWTVGLVMLLIPTWDILPGYLYFTYLCNTKAGVFVYEQVELPEEYFLKAGDGDERYQKRSPHAYALGDELNQKKIEEDYRVQYRFDRDYSYWGHLFMNETVILNSSGKKLGAARSFYYRGGWVFSSLLMGMAGSHVCPDEGSPGSSEFIHSSIFEKVFKRAN